MSLKRIKYYFLFNISLLLLTSCNPWIWQNIMIYESNKGLGPCEPSITINPKDKNNIVAGSVVDYVHISEDGGSSWITKKLDSPLGVYGDPCLVAGPEGRIYYLHLGDPEKKSWASERILESIVVQYSDDNGKSWSYGVGIGTNPPKQQDKEWAFVDPSTGHIYVTWTEFDKYGSKSPQCFSRIMFSKSVNKGETWTNAIKISSIEGNCIDDDETNEGAVPAVDQDGNVYVTWSLNDKLYFNKSMDGGTTWLEEEIAIIDQPGGWDIDIEGLGRANGMPVTCIRNANGNREILVNWIDKRDGVHDVYLSKSKDGGIKWSEPLKVNNDAHKTDCFFPWMTVDESSGYIYIIYYQRSLPDSNLTNVVLSVSTDGGSQFKNVVLNPQGFQTPDKSVFFGDYNNISVVDGVIRPIWTEYHNGKLSVWTSLLDEKSLISFFKKN